MTSATLKLAKVVSFVRRTSDVRFFQCLQISMKLLQYRINGQFDPFDIGTGGRRLLLKHRSATPRRLCRSRLHPIRTFGVLLSIDWIAIVIIAGLFG
jgi:hypothetical protein